MYTATGWECVISRLAALLRVLRLELGKGKGRAGKERKGKGKTFGGFPMHT
jgi:hypothetical protein